MVLAFHTIFKYLIDDDLSIVCLGYFTDAGEGGKGTNAWDLAILAAKWLLLSGTKEPHFPSGCEVDLASTPASSLVIRVDLVHLAG